MRNWIAFLAGAIRRFSPVDALFLMLFIVSAGVIFGVYLVDFFRSILGVVWLVFALSWLYVVVRIFFKPRPKP